MSRTVPNFVTADDLAAANTTLLGSDGTNVRAALALAGIDYAAAEDRVTDSGSDLLVSLMKNRPGQALDSRSLVGLALAYGLSLGVLAARESDRRAEASR